MAKLPKTIAAMDGIAFDSAAMHQELRHLRNIAKGFLHADSHAVLEEFITQLEHIKIGARTGGRRWEISREVPLKTVISHGKYDRSPGHGHRIFGEISGAWEIVVPKKPKGLFILTGLAAMHASIKLEDGTTIYNWHFDVGNASAPGCYFHVQLAEDANKLPVPRLPSLLLTPSDVLEFLIGELFQDDWPQLLSQDSDDANGWRKAQRQRLQDLLIWHTSLLREENVSWAHMKACQPPVDLFLKD
jgi:hypothetical protein